MLYLRRLYLEGYHCLKLRTSRLICRHPEVDGNITFLISLLLSTLDRFGSYLVIVKHHIAQLTAEFRMTDSLVIFVLLAIVSPFVQVP